MVTDYTEQSSPQLARKSAQGMLLTQYMIIIGLLISGLAYQTVSIPLDLSFTLLSLILLLLLVWVLWSWKSLTNSWFDPYSMFIVAAVLFHGGQVFLMAFSLNNTGLLSKLFRDHVLIEALYLAIFGIAAFHLGALLIAYIRRYPSNRDPNKKTHTSDPPNITLVHTFGWIMILLAIFPAMIVVRDGLQVTQSSGYFGLFQQDSVVGIGSIANILAAFLVPGALFIVVDSKEKPLNQIISAVIILTYSASQFLLGFRAQGAMPLFAYVWLWHRTVRKLPKSFLFGSGLILLLIVFPFVKLTRNLSGNQWLDYSTWIKVFITNSNPVTDILSEMGASLSTVAYTLELVPLARGFEFGGTYLYAFLTILPNLFWRVHPAIAHGLAADWLIQTVDPTFARIGGGMGYSFIAEAYLNFGWLGTPIILAIIGLLFAGLVLWAHDGRDAAKMASVASFVSFFMVFARGESGSVFRALIWYALIPYAGIIILDRLRERKRVWPADITNVVD